MRSTGIRILNRIFKHLDAQVVRRSWLDAQLNPPQSNSKATLSRSAAQAQLTDDVQSGCRRISDLQELDALLKEVEAAAKVSDDAMREVFKSFEFLPDASDLPADPFSADYSNYQFNLYRTIANREYSPANEMSDWVDVQAATRVPFPYYTQSFRTVSDHLLMTGLIIKTLALPQGARILEFGPGWGNTTLALCQMGYQVTAIDIEQRFLDVIGERCRGLPLEPLLIRNDFSAIHELQAQYDAILFYESFHHCSDHYSLMLGLKERLSAHGQVMFASEPITDGFPMPWGVRTDGMSLWAIRNFGWLELGFTESYFREAMRRAGFIVEKHTFEITDLGKIFVARAN